MSFHLHAQLHESLSGFYEIEVKLRLVPLVMRKVLQAVVQEVGGSMILFDRKMLEFIMQHWLWSTHFLTFDNLDPSECKACVTALGWLSA